jgi:hypothetical protein
MFRLWKLKFRRWRVQAKFDKESKRLRKQKESRDKINELAAEEYYTIRDFDEAIDHLLGRALLRQANALDVEVPPTEDRTMWTTTENGDHYYFTLKGRSYVRKLVDAEKARRFDVKTLWVTKFWIPLLAASIGIIGALTGFFAILHKK